MRIRTKNQNGFTLVEALVAITVLLVGIVGPMTIAARGLQTAFYAREQVVAFSLGQEAIERVRAVRDNNALVSTSWLDGIPSTCDADNSAGCGVDIRDNSFQDCGQSADACLLKYDSGSLSGNRGFYTYVTGDATPFTRRMWVDETVLNQEAIVTVEVSWTSGLIAGDKTITVQTRLFNHYDEL